MKIRLALSLNFHYHHIRFPTCITIVAIAVIIMIVCSHPKPALRLDVIMNGVALPSVCRDPCLPGRGTCFAAWRLGQPSVSQYACVSSVSLCTNHLVCVSYPSVNGNCRRCLGCDDLYVFVIVRDSYKLGFSTFPLFLCQTTNLVALEIAVISADCCLQPTRKIYSFLTFPVLCRVKS